MEDLSTYLLNYKDFDDEIASDILEKEGVLVITDVFSEEDSDTYFGNIKATISKIINLDLEKAFEDKRDLPPQPRTGLFQSLFANLPEIWKLRRDERVKNIFRKLYSQINNREENNFVISGDGLSIRPPFEKKVEIKDWAHVDQISLGIKCIQGQVVLTNTTACFRCSPRSHLLHESLMKKYGLSKKIEKTIKGDQWFKLPYEIYDGFKNELENIGGKFQIPILAPKGSMIFWYSNTFHSAMHQHDDSWRCVVYICYRPLREFSKRNLKTRKDAILFNRVTNHWSIKTFPKISGGRWAPKIETFSSVLQTYIKNPEKIYEVIEKPSEDDYLISE